MSCRHLVLLGTIVLMIFSQARAGDFKKGELVEVEWRGNWFPAQIVKAESLRWFIRYDGFDASRNEWVEENRIRIRRTPQKVEKTKALDTFYLVVVGERKSRPEAVRLAKLASSKLPAHIAEQTLKAPPPKRVHTGRVITLHQDPAGSFVVSAYLSEDKAWAQAILAEARKSFADASIRVSRLEQSQLDGSYEAYTTTQLIILGSKKKYPEAKKLAESVSKKTGMPFSNRGMIYDPRRGLIWPDDFEDEIFAGSYYGRRSHDCDNHCISIERSDFYFGFRPGYYIVVGGLAGDDFKRELKKFKRVVPDAYAKKTVVYLGCMH